MAITQVQNASARANGVTFKVVVFGSDVTAGNSIVAACAFDNATPTMTVTDSQSNPYTQDELLSADREASIDHSSDVAGGATTVTFTMASTGNVGGCIIEYDKVLELDQSASASQASGTSHSCGSITTTVADEVIVTSSRVTDAFAATVAAGFVELAALDREYFQERIVTSTETATGTWTSAASENVTSVIASYNEVVAGGEDQDWSWQGGGVRVPPDREIDVASY